MSTRTASKLGLLALDNIDAFRDENAGANVTSVAAALGALAADNVAPDLESLLGVTWMTAHVHDLDSAALQTR